MVIKVACGWAEAVRKKITRTFRLGWGRKIKESSKK